MVTYGYYGYVFMNLEKAFLFWPVQVIGVSKGWVYGTYAALKSLGHRELLERGRLRVTSRRHAWSPGFSEAEVDKSFRYHEALGIALEAKRVLLETYQLDEQRYLEPTALVSDVRAAEAFQEFMNLGTKEPDAAMRFIAEFGEFDHLEQEKNRFVGRGIPAEIQQFCEQSVQQRKAPFVVALRDFWRVRDDILGLWNLGSALSHKNITETRDECIRRRPQSNFDREPNWLAVGKAILCSDLSASLNPGRRNPRLVLSERDGKLVALTMGTTVRASLYLTLLDMIVSKTEYKRCPNCPKYFVVTGRHDKRFCTDTCRNAAKVKRWRNRHKAKSK